MLVYGDRSELADPGQRLHALGEKLRAATAMPMGIRRHSEIVAALIGGGQLLQGVADHDFQCANRDRRSPAADQLAAFVDALAKVVVASWDSGFSGPDQLPAAPRVEGLPERVELRAPEGFAFYAVYPEAYIEAARRLDLSASPRVIGLRSIGTSLAAIVAAALDAPPPLSIRPFGDPSARVIAVDAELERELLRGEAHYVIVDEGPGQSGSSFGAVADWLQVRGVPLGRIAFLPSHAGEPGAAAGEAHRTRWRRAQRSPGDLGPSLRRRLGEWIEESVGPLDGIGEISAGEWRREVYEKEEDWPAAVRGWERRKFLATSGGERFLVKFAGLASFGERKLGIARALHAAGLVPEPVSVVHGFLVERWVEGAQPLGRADQPIDALARYIGTRARLFPVERESGAGPAELFQMALRNISLGLASEAAQALQSRAPDLDKLARRVVRVRTDNKLDVHEWLRTSDGRLLKTDALDHHCAHDLIGCQDMAWDVAGAISEFQLDLAQAARLVDATERASGRVVDAELLDFYRLCYPAFRLGQAALGAQMCGGDAPGAARLARLGERYRAELQILLLEHTRSDSPVFLDRLDGGTTRCGNNPAPESVDDEEARLSC